MDAAKLAPLRKGLLEFLILEIVSSGDVYVADILDRLGDTDFATREGTLYPLLSRMRREGLSATGDDPESRDPAAANFQSFGTCG